jgi:hypothetical protein
MNTRSLRPRRLGANVFLAALIALSTTIPAFAIDSVTQTLTAGSLSASVADATMTSSVVQHSAHLTTGTMILTADDSTGSGDGWNVTISTSTFAYTGPNGGTAIPAANFVLTSAATPVMTAGQAVDGTGGPKVPASSPLLDLSVPRKVIQANALFGGGTYTQSLGVSLLIPGDSRAGTYTGTLTTTSASAP